jgi:hypothetical protein
MGQVIRRLGMLIVAVSVAAALVVAAPASAKKAKKVTKCDARAGELIQAAFIQYFVAPTAAEKVKYVKDGKKIVASTDASIAANAEAGLTPPDVYSVPVDLKATCDGKKAATFTYDIARIPKTATPPSTVPAGTKGFGLSLTGDAVLDTKKGQWLVTAATICDLMNGSPAPKAKQAAADCYRAIGLTPVT